MMPPNTLRPGQLIPQITLPDQDGQPVALHHLTGQPLVVYFYPKDHTPGCTAEACAFRDHYEDFKKPGARIMGISSDTVASHRSFADKYRLPFPVLSDPEHEAARAFGVRGSLFGLLPARVTFIFDKNGKLIRRFDSLFRARRHIRKALDALRH